MGYVELGAIYSPGKDLDFALGVIRNTSDGDVRTTQVTMGSYLEIPLERLPHPAVTLALSPDIRRVRHHVHSARPAFC